MRRVVVLCFVAGACGGSPKSPVAKVPEVAPSAVDFLHASCARRERTVIPLREPGARQGSSIALARSSEHLYAYVADADSRSIHTVSIDDKVEVGRTRLDGEPKQLLLLPDGRVAVTLTSTSRIAVLEPAEDPSAAMRVLCQREAPDEPWGVALSPDDSKLVVTSVWAAALTTFDAKTFTAEKVTPLPRDPRGVLVDEANVAFVAHAVGAKVSAVELGRERSSTLDVSLRKSTPLARPENTFVKRSGSQGFAIARATISDGKAKTERIFVPMVSVDPGDPERRSAIYYGPPYDGVPKETPTVIVIDPEAQKSLGTSLLGITEKELRRECLLPRAAVVRGETLLVACAGIDSVVELDALGSDPFRTEKRRFSVRPGPEGIAIDSQHNRAIVFSQIGAAVSIIALEGRAALPEVIALDYRPDPALASVARGRQIFQSTDDPRITEDGLACSSCHIDGRDDGITWSTPMGPRQTPMLAGRLAKTNPYGWDGVAPSVDLYISNTIRNLGGRGLQPSELADLASYVTAAKGPARHATENEVVEKGRALFAAGCSSCHVLGATDGASHRVGSSDRELQIGVDTPSLSFVRGTAPYFHDGRYDSLESLLVDPASQMGQSSLLSMQDRSALVAYLRTL